MKQAIPWRKLSVEAFVIIASILLAFAIDAWWQGRQENVLEKLYLQRLLAEVEINREIATRTIDTQRAALEASRRTFQRVKAASVTKGEEVDAIADAYRATVTLLPRFIDDVYQELLSTGNIRLVQSQELRNGIFVYQRQLRIPPRFELASLEYRNIVRGILNPDLKLEIRDCGFAENCPLSISETDAQSTFEDILSETHIDRSLSSVVEELIRAEPYLSAVLAASDDLEIEIRTAIR
jgi:hypothetical protein